LQHTEIGKTQDITSSGVNLLRVRKYCIHSYLVIYQHIFLRTLRI